MTIHSSQSADHQENVKAPADYIVLIALAISITALATDIMLPALGVIGRDYHLADMNDTQYVVSVFFLGFALGQFVVGPLSDSTGRRKVILWGYAVFLVGCVLSIMASTWSLLLLGRFLQGLGASAPRIVTVAIVRDEYKGRVMASIMSIVMAVFIIVPALAPAFGQGLMALGGWRMTFMGLVFFALPTALWFMVRIPETLPIERRQPFTLASIRHGLGVILTTRVTMGYTIAAGLIFGLFLGYLSTTQKIFHITFGKGDLFAFYFGLAALSIGAASLINARLVMWLGMRRLSHMAVAALTLWSSAFLMLMWLGTGFVPDFWIFMSWLLVVFFFIGIMFGNMMALAMEPLGDFAGLGSAFVGAVSTLISLPLGWIVSSSFDGTLLSMTFGFAGFGLAAWLVMIRTDSVTG